ncbi:MAG: nuclear transport factor 2 family protein [Actinomycetota bacterium]
MADRAAVEDWVRRYIDAWDSNDPEEIGALFTDSARYYTAPHRQPWSGREDIVEGWLDRKDEEGEWRFSWEVLGVDGDLGFVKGVTASSKLPDCSNLWVIRLEEDGRASEFVEYWMEVEEEEE